MLRAKKVAEERAGAKLPKRVDQVPEPAAATGWVMRGMRVERVEEVPGVTPPKKVEQAPEPAEAKVAIKGAKAARAGEVQSSESPHSCRGMEVAQACLSGNIADPSSTYASAELRDMDVCLI